MIKDILKSGDILLVHTKGFSPFSWGIRELTCSFWNHAGMIVIDIDEKIFCIEAILSGVVKTPIEKYLNTKKYVLRVVRLREWAFKDEEEYSKGLLKAQEKIKNTVGLNINCREIFWFGV